MSLVGSELEVDDDSLCRSRRPTAPPPLRWICVHSRSPIVACSVEQMHIGHSLAGLQDPYGYFVEPRIHGSGRVYAAHARRLEPSECGVSVMAALCRVGWSVGRLLLEGTNMPDG
ncbi:hypothetical protein KM043_008236 [Ampulex compressa]|nr:hypothetical protein KM043_008236 [Ampulex compressa]